MQHIVESSGMLHVKPYQEVYKETYKETRKKRKHTQKKGSTHAKKILPFKPKKSLGQNFLNDPLYLDRIFQSIPSSVIPHIDNGVQLIEIGIGLGDLTERLLSRYTLVAYEIDAELVRKARIQFQSKITQGQLQLIHADALQISHTHGYLFDSDYFLVSNLPYYVATAIILRALKDSNCKGFLVMTQKEVAQKFCAKPKESAYCGLSIIAQAFGMTHYLFEVPKEAFSPAPKVHSAVFSFERTECVYTQALESLLHAAFLAPRKKLFSNLLQCSAIQNRAKLEAIFERIGLHQETRAHEVSLQDYCHIAQLIESY